MTNNFVSCGADSIQSTFKKYFEKYGDEYLTKTQLANYLNLTTNKFLHSYGGNLNYKTKKISKNHNKSFINTIKKFKDDKCFELSKLYIDSGGFQLANGALHAKDIPKFIDMYYNMIKENSQYIDHAFILDIPPGPKSVELFSNYEEVYDLNLYSYQKCHEILGDDIVKNKMIYVHHFRTPKLQELWNRLLWDENLAEGFSYLSVGGLVAQSASSHQLPILLIGLPLAMLAKWCIDKNIRDIKFHILGGAYFTEVYYYKMFEKHFKHCFDINLTITYDSSLLFKAFTMGRNVYLFDNNKILRTIRVCSKMLHYNFDGITLEERMYQEFKNIYNIGKFNKILTLNKNPIYDKETDKLDIVCNLYFFLFLLSIYNKIEQIVDEQIDKNYNLYLNNDIKNFSEESFNIITKLYNGKATAKNKTKTFVLADTLNLIKDLDLEKVNYLIQKHTFKDDLTEFEKTCLKF